MKLFKILLTKKIGIQYILEGFKFKNTKSHIFKSRLKKKTTHTPLIPFELKAQHMFQTHEYTDPFKGKDLKDFQHFFL